MIHPLLIKSVLLLRAGYVLIQIGSIPVDNVYNVVLQNIVDITGTLICYGIFGSFISFGESTMDGLVGKIPWNNYNSHISSNMDQILHGFCGVLISSALITTTLAGRCYVITGLLITCLYTSLMQPLIMHWAWHAQGWLYTQQFINAHVYLQDNGGGMVVHFTGGLVALLATLCLGRRLIKLKDLHESSLGPESPGTTFLGYMLVIIGLVTFSLPSPFSNQPGENSASISSEINTIPLIIFNNLLAISTGLFVILLQCLCYGHVTGYWVLQKCLQGCLAGIVAISSGVGTPDGYLPQLAFVGAVLGAILFYLVALLTEKMYYEDYCNIVPIHMIGGALGVILKPILSCKNKIDIKESAVKVLFQCFSIFITFVTVCVSFLPIFIFLNCFHLLRNKSEELNHRRSINAGKNIGVRHPWWRIFNVNKTSAVLQPGLDNRSISSLNKVLKEMDEARSENLQKKIEKKDEEVQEKRNVILIPTESSITTSHLPSLVTPMPKNKIETKTSSIIRQPFPELMVHQHELPKSKIQIKRNRLENLGTNTNVYGFPVIVEYHSQQPEPAQKPEVKTKQIENKKEQQTLNSSPTEARKKLEKRFKYTTQTDSSENKFEKVTPTLEKLCGGDFEAKSNKKPIKQADCNANYLKSLVTNDKTRKNIENKVLCAPEKVPQNFEPVKNSPPLKKMYKVIVNNNDSSVINRITSSVANGPKTCRTDSFNLSEFTTETSLRLQDSYPEESISDANTDLLENLDAIYNQRYKNAPQGSNNNSTCEEHYYF